jgi:3-dehydroquinate synthase class II
LVLAHSFATAGAVEALVPLPDGRWEILDFLAAAGDQADIVDGSLRVRLSGAFRGVAAELRRI